MMRIAQPDADAVVLISIEAIGSHDTSSLQAPDGRFEGQGRICIGLRLCLVIRRGGRSGGSRGSKTAGTRGSSLGGNSRARLACP
jgi:hypothetical protein